MSDVEKHHAKEGIDGEAAVPDAYPIKSHLDGQDDSLFADMDEVEKKHIVRRIDRRVVTTVGAMYCVSLMDRTNLSAAIVAGMGKELLLINDRYQIITLVFFISYVLFQPPSTVIVRKVGPRIHLSLITLLWGAVMIGFGFVKVWDQMVALRFILGIFEAGFFPSCVYLLSTWYTRYEVGKRFAAFYLIGCVASAFAGLLAAGLMQMNGLANLSGWRWIFIIEGIITCVLGIAGYWLLVDFPDSKRKDWSFLGQRERAFIIAKVNADRGDVKPLPFSLAKYFRAGLDWKIWAYAMIFFNTTTVTYALAYFMPIILKDNMGFTDVQAQCLVAPPYAFAGFIMFGTGWAGDRYRMRGPIIIFNVVLILIGIPIVGWAANAGARYFGIFLMTAGANANIPVVMSYQANNIRGQWKRALTSATLVGMGGVGGICGSLVFRTQDNPTYRPGLYTCIATSVLTIILVALLSFDIMRQNKAADRGEKELEADDEDYQPGFRYTI